MRVLGVDPGSLVTGYGVVEREAGRLRYVVSGVIRLRALVSGPERLKKIHDELLLVIDRFVPDAISLERNFVAANVQSALRLGEARASAMLAAAERGLPLFEYAPNQVKLAVGAFGHADKSQIKLMVRRTLNLAETVALADDAADALALAVCHLGRARFTAMETALKGTCRARRGRQ